MNDRIAVITGIHSRIYTPEDHAAILLMLNQSPNAVYAVCQRIGYDGPVPGAVVPEDQVGLDEWLGGMVEEFRVASLPHSKRSGSRDAFISIRHKWPMFKTLGDLAEEIASEVKGRME